MAEKGVARLSLRLNLQNEQHSRVYRVLSSLNRDIHKSENQFIINAVDFYINSFDRDEILEPAAGQPQYITADDLEEIKREMESSLKDELIRLLGSAITGSPAAGRQEIRADPVLKGNSEEVNPFAAEAANRWG